MAALPKEIVRVLRVFEDVFSERVWDWVQVLVVGATLTPGQRTVTAVLRVMGLSEERQFQNYHRAQPGALVEREVSRRLLLLVVETLVPADAPAVVGLDETIERRRGAKIAAKGIYHDPARARVTLSRPAACAGSRCRCWPRSRPGRSGACHS